MSDFKYKNKTKVGPDTTVYEYSDGQVQHRHREKAKRIEELSASMDKLRAQIKKDLGSKDMGTRLKALATAIIDETYSRVGNDTSASERGHYGVTTWQKKHVTFGSGKATFKYVGKSGVTQEKVVRDPDVIRILKEHLKDKKKDDNIFDCEAGSSSTCIRGQDVNDYLKPYDVTAKDLRGYHANRLMQETLKAARKGGGALPKDTKGRVALLKKEFKKALETVSSMVGHEAATLQKNYLVPAMEDAYMKDGTVIEKLDQTKTASASTSPTSQIRLAIRVASIWSKRQKSVR